MFEDAIALYLEAFKDSNSSSENWLSFNLAERGHRIFSLSPFSGGRWISTGSIQSWLFFTV